MSLPTFGWSKDKAELWIRSNAAFSVSLAVKDAKYYDVKPTPVVTMPWTFENVLKASELSCPVIGTILRDYKFAGLFSPYKHQRDICSFLVSNRRAFCLADMGTGKTASCVWAVDYLMKIGQVSRVLILCDMNNMRNTWESEFYGINPQLYTTVIHDTSKAAKQKLAKSTAPIHIVNHDGIKSMYEELMRNSYDLVIIDELTRFKNANSQRFKRASELVQSKAKWVWGLTGTPTPNSPDEAYGQIKLINPGKLKGMSYYTFRDKVMRKVTQFKWVAKTDANITIQQLMQPAIVIKKEDCLDLPPVTSVYKEVPLSEQQKQWYDRLKHDRLVSDAAVGEVSAVNGGALFNKLIQIATGAIYNDNGEAFAIDIENRLVLAKAIVERSREESSDPKKGKTLIFVPFKHTAEIVRQYMEKYFKIAVITGDTPVKERDKIIRSFQTTEHPDLIIAVPGTMSHGVTATSASTIIWFGPVTSNEVYTQACQRINRPGQTQNMYMVHLYGSTTERKLYELLQHRQVSQRNLLALYEEFENEVQ